MLLQVTPTERAVLYAFLTQEGDPLTVDEICNLAYHQSGVSAEEADPAISDLRACGLLTEYAARPGRYVLTLIGHWAAAQLEIEL